MEENPIAFFLCNFFILQSSKPAQKATARRKKSTTTATTTNKSTDKTSSIQSRLGMFGFQKKLELKH